MKGIGTMRLSSLSLAILALTTLAGCNDETNIIEQPKLTPDVAVDMRGVFSGYQEAMDILDNTTFGQITDQMASSRQSVDRLYLDKLEALDRSALSDEDKIYYDTFRFDRNIGIRGASLPNTRFGNFTIPITHFYNYIEWNAETAGAKQKDVEAYKSHVQVVREFTAWVNNLHSQYSMGQVEHAQLPKVLIERLAESTKGASALLKIGLNDINNHNGDYEPAFIAEYQRAVDDATTATDKLVTYLGSASYISTARGSGSDSDGGSTADENIGWGDLPNGQAWYQWQLDRNSTTGKPAMELSQLGEDLVADAKAEMERVAKLIVANRGKIVSANWRKDSDSTPYNRTFTLADDNGKINLAEFFAYLNSETFFYGRDGRTITGTPYAQACTSASAPSACEAALVDYYKFKNDANGVVAKYFKPIETDYSIVPVPASRELYDGVASYGGNEFNLNTNPDYSLQKWNVSTLLLHEAAPGHHFQNAYSIEYPPANKPEYIKNVGYTAYAEGWALYTEWLGMEMSIYGELNEEGKPTFVNATGMCKVDLNYDDFQGGIYKDAEECNALQYFGSLNEAQLRNMRLAVDTGIHAKGWSIDKAREYMSSNSALGAGDIESESFRYAAYVGQAVSYKSGYLVIKEMLEKAQSELGNEFDWAEFHDQLLKYGDQPMEVVETSIDNWIKSKS